MDGVCLAVCIGGDVVGAGRVGGKGSGEPLELFLVGVERGSSSLEEGGNHHCCAILYWRGVSLLRGHGY